MIKILLAGEGGQGVQTVAKIIAKTAQRQGNKSSYLPSFGVEQRGGVSLAFIKIDEQPISYPRFDKADIILAFCNRSIESISKYIHDRSLLIYDDSAIEDKFLDPIRDRVKKIIRVPAQQIAMEKYSSKILNMILLGAVLSFSEIELKKIDQLIVDELKNKIIENPKIKEMNLAAVREGMKIAKETVASEFTGSKPKEIQKEFKDDKKTWTRFPEYCKGCSLCVVRCPVKALNFGKNVGFLGNPLPEIDINKCIACGLCEKTCPDGAIKLRKE